MVKKPNIIPNNAGVYIFKYRNIPLYIGKAADLKKRLASYFRVNATQKVLALREEATALTWIETKSEIEALIREAELIKHHLPKYNVLMRDDKSYFYVAVTRDEFPKIFVTHKPRLSRKSSRLQSGRLQNTRSIGPFTSGSALFGTLRLLRRIFPYCTCARPHKRSCLNAQIGRCPGFCCLKSAASPTSLHYSLIRTNRRIVDADVEKYRGNIRSIIAVLSGKRKRILSQLKREMRDAAKKQDFERAARIRDQIAGLENIFAHRHLFEVPLQTDGRGTSGIGSWLTRIEPEIRRIFGAKRRIRRVEGYDISNISGTAATGSLVVFVDGKPVKSAYRKFRIKTVVGANDTAMHREMMARRIAHPEWRYPDVIVMDGGLPQLHAAQTAWKSRTAGVKSQTLVITALAKREEELYIERKQKPIRLDSFPQDVKHFFQNVRDESHRFAKKYHHKLREMSYR